MRNPQKRTPKVKAFVREPYVKCPDCECNESFGVLMVCDRHYVRRCVNCWFDQSIQLPPLKKKIIYLDQFVISNMAKELDPDRPEEKKRDLNGFYLELFELLDRLSKLQLIVCPDSPIQDDESIVTGPHYQKIRAVFRHLSHGISFRDATTIFHARILRAFKLWLHGQGEPDIDRSLALSKNPDVWNDVFRIELNHNFAGLSDELKIKREKVTQELHSVCQSWIDAPSFDFQQTVLDEMGGHGKSLLQQYAKACADQYMVKQGKAPIIKDMFYLLSPAVSLITSMLQELHSIYPDIEECFVRIREFFVSDIYRSISNVKISALCWASIARHVRSVGKPEKFPQAGMYNDIDAVSHYSPFCDAMFVDKEFFHFISQPELRDEFQNGPRFFCLQKKSKRDFLSYLRNIESSASTEHIAAVAAVYGTRHENPFVEMLSMLKNQNP